MTCSFGAAPSSFVALPACTVTAGGPQAGTIMDNVPMLNIPPFGVCTSLANPAVASATAAALGVLTPMPCVPVTPAPWMPGAVTTMVTGLPALDASCTLNCLWAGIITISAPGQFTVSVG